MGESRRSDPKDPLTFDPYEQLNADYPDLVRVQVCSVDTTLHPLSFLIGALFILLQLWIKQPKATSVPKVSNATMAAEMLMALGTA